MGAHLKKLDTYTPELREEAVKLVLAQGPTELACLVHIRRKFFDVHAASVSRLTGEALRQQQAVPVLVELHAWLLASQRAVAVGRGTGNIVDPSFRTVV
jgi:transposase